MNGVEVVEKVSGSVCRIYVSRPSEDGGFSLGHGSGFCIGQDDEGRSIVVTNAHVVGVQQGSQHALGFGVRGELTGNVELVGWHPWVDIAVLRAELDFEPQALGFRDGLPGIGEDCMAFGFPWRVDLSVSKGIVSGLDRDTELGPALFPLRWLQSDVLINEGNSGGPLIDSNGEVIGVASMGLGDLRVEEVEFQDRDRELIRRKVEAFGISLFVPCDLAAKAVDGVLDNDRDGIPVGDEGVEFDREFWGAFLQEQNIPALRDRPGVVVKEIREGSPAESAGIKVDDSIVQIGDMVIDHPADLYAWRLGSDSWQTQSTVSLWRDGETVTVELQAEEARVDPSEYEYRILSI